MVGLRLRSEEHGFSLVESMVIFGCIILIAAGAGLLANREGDSSPHSLKPNVLQLGTEPSTRAATSTTTTLELSSLAIDITVPNAISDLVYAAPNGTGGYGLSTKTLTADDTNCVATGNAPPLGDFFKESGVYPGSEIAPGRLVKQFIGFYIAWNSPQAPCSTNGTIVTLANQQTQDLTQSFGSVEEAPPGS